MKLGFIGCGNIAGAIINACLASGYASADEIIAAEPYEEARERAKSSYAIHVTDSNSYVASQAEIIFICVKPQVLEEVLDEIGEVLEDHQLLITVVAGKPLSFYERHLGFDNHIKIVRLMPNMPSLIGMGMSAVCANSLVSENDLNAVLGLIGTFGDAEIVPESIFDTVTSISASSPAYVFMMIEAMADAAVAGGMPRDKAYRFIAQTVSGSAGLVLATGRHPADLKDMVCSPSGTAIEALKVLEEKGFRSALIEACEAARKRAGEIV